MHNYFFNIQSFPYIFLFLLKFAYSNYSCPYGLNFNFIFFIKQARFLFNTAILNKVRFHWYVLFIHSRNNRSLLEINQCPLWPGNSLLCNLLHWTECYVTIIRFSFFYTIIGVCHDGDNINVLISFSVGILTAFVTESIN